MPNSVKGYICNCGLKAIDSNGIFFGKVINGIYRIIKIILPRIDVEYIKIFRWSIWRY